MTYLLAQDMLQTGRVIEYGIGVTAFGLIVWIVRHVTTNTIPDLVKDFRDSLKDQAETFERTQTYQVDTFDRVNREQRTEFREVLENDRILHHKREEALRLEFRESLRDAMKGITEGKADPPTERRAE